MEPIPVQLEAEAALDKSLLGYLCICALGCSCSRRGPRRPDRVSTRRSRSSRDRSSWRFRQAPPPPGVLPPFSLTAARSLGLGHLLAGRSLRDLPRERTSRSRHARRGSAGTSAGGCDIRRGVLRTPVTGAPQLGPCVHLPRGRRGRSLGEPAPSSSFVPCGADHLWFGAVHL